MAGCWWGDAGLRRTAKSIFTVAKLELMENQCQHVTISHHSFSTSHQHSLQQWTQYDIVTITQRHLHLQPDTRDDGGLSLRGYSERVLRCCCGVWRTFLDVTQDKRA